MRSVGVTPRGSSAGGRTLRLQAMATAPEARPAAGSDRIAVVAP
jgi:hypothetical protein